MSEVFELYRFVRSRHMLFAPGGCDSSVPAGRYGALRVLMGRTGDGVQYHGECMIVITGGRMVSAGCIGIKEESIGSVWLRCDVDCPGLSFQLAFGRVDESRPGPVTA